MNADICLSIRSRQMSSVLKFFFLFNNFVAIAIKRNVFTVLFYTQIVKEKKNTKKRQSPGNK